MLTSQQNLKQQNKAECKKASILYGRKYGASYTRHNPYYINCQIGEEISYQSFSNSDNAIIIASNKVNCENMKEIVTEDYDIESKNKHVEDPENVHIFCNKLVPNKSECEFHGDNNVNEKICAKDDIEKKHSFYANKWYDRFYASPFKTPLMYNRSNVYIIRGAHTSCKYFNWLQKESDRAYLQNDNGDHCTLKVQNKDDSKQYSNRLMQNQNTDKNNKNVYYTCTNNCDLIQTNKQSKRKRACKIYEYQEIRVEGSPITVRAITSKREAPRRSLACEKFEEFGTNEEQSINIGTHMEKGVNSVTVSSCIINNNKDSTNKYVVNSVDASGALADKTIDHNDNIHNDIDKLIVKDMNSAICCDYKTQENVNERKTCHAHKEYSELEWEEQEEEEENYWRRKCANANETSLCSSNEQSSERRTQGITIDINDNSECISCVNNVNNTCNTDSSNVNDNICASQWDLCTPRNQRSYSRSFIVHVDSYSSVSQPELNCGLSETAPLTINYNSHNNYNDNHYGSEDDDVDDYQEEYESGMVGQPNDTLYCKSHYKDYLKIDNMNENNIHFDHVTRESSCNDNGDLEKEVMENKEELCEEGTNFLRACTPRNSSQYNHAHNFYEFVFLSNKLDNKNKHSSHAKLDCAYLLMRPKDATLREDNDYYCNNCVEYKRHKFNENNNINNNIRFQIEELDTDECDDHVFVSNDNKNNHESYIWHVNKLVNVKDQRSLQNKLYIDNKENNSYHFRNYYDIYKDALLKIEDDANLFSLYAGSETHQYTPETNNRQVHKENKFHKKDNAAEQTEDEYSDDWQCLQMLLLHRNRENAEVMQEIMSKYLDAASGDGEDDGDNKSNDDAAKYQQTHCKCRFCRSDVVFNNTHSNSVCLYSRERQERITEIEYSEKHSSAMEELMSKICGSTQSLHCAYNEKRVIEITKKQKNRRKIWQKSQLHPLRNNRESIQLPVTNKRQ